LPSASREALGKATVKWRRQATFLCRVVYWHSTKPLPSARQKTLGKEAFVVTGFAECSLPMVTLGKGFAEYI